MISQPFVYERPESLEEALALLAEHRADAEVMAGGQDLVPRLSLSVAAPAAIIDIGQIDELIGLRALKGLVTLGARATHRQIARSDEVRAHCGLLASAAEQIGGGPQVRNRGTIGGAVAAANPVYDYLPCLVALDATAHVASSSTHRAVPVEELLRVDAAGALEGAELITEISVPAPGPGHRFTYEKLKFTDGCYLIAGVACVADVGDDGRLRSPRLAIGGATASPIRLTEVEALVEDNAITLELLDTAAEVTRRALGDPISDTLADGEYRRRVAGTLVRRALETVSSNGDEA